LLDCRAPLVIIVVVGFIAIVPVGQCPECCLNFPPVPDCAGIEHPRLGHSTIGNQLIKEGRRNPNIVCCLYSRQPKRDDGTLNRPFDGSIRGSFFALVFGELENHTKIKNYNMRRLQNMFPIVPFSIKYVKENRSPQKL
jgi:hypothetical protein